MSPEEDARAILRLALHHERGEPAAAEGFCAALGADRPGSPATPGRREAAGGAPGAAGVRRQGLVLTGRPASTGQQEALAHPDSPASHCSGGPPGRRGTQGAIGWLNVAGPASAQRGDPVQMSSGSITTSRKHCPPLQPGGGCHSAGRQPTSGAARCGSGTGWRPHRPTWLSPRLTSSPPKPYSRKRRTTPSRAGKKIDPPLPKRRELSCKIYKTTIEMKVAPKSSPHWLPLACLPLPFTCRCRPLRSPSGPGRSQQASQINSVQARSPRRTLPRPLPLPTTSRVSLAPKVVGALRTL